MSEASANAVIIMFAGCLAAFVLTILLIKLVGPKLPRDHGREFAVAGELSAGKIRGAGILMMPVFAVVTAAVSGFSLKMIVYMVLVLLSMLSGYLDDRSETPWSELKKGIVDFVICLLMAGALVYFEPETSVLDYGAVSVPVAKPLYVILAACFLWLMINAVNCADGIDGLSSGLVINSMIGGVAASYILGTQGKVILPCAILASVLFAYLIFNSEPSTVLMGDAGSRPIGLFLGFVFLRMGNALFAIPCCIVLLIDGLLGLVKLGVLRSFKAKKFMANLRTPIHDHFRKNHGTSNQQVRFAFNLVQILISFAFICVMLLVKG
ncbi:MAG: phospho-N-acetylmuramoyl-pentapeptide-transferase [Firmicutes bacterium]|nr:phospho-N-acetylmuramoyl-pentapeptide-transferase [Bacillota bacterium]